MIDIEKVNSSYLHNIAFGFEAGLRVPEIRYIEKTPEDELQGMRSNGNWTEDSGMMIRKKDGSRIICIDFWDGEKFIYPHIAINDRRLLGGGQGPQLEANSVTLFRNIDRICIDEFRKIAHLIKQREDTYRGYVTLEVTITPTDTWFGSVGFGLVADYIFLLSKLYGIDISQDVPDWGIDHAHNFVCSLRLWAYPYSSVNNARVIEILPYQNGMDISYGEDCYIVMSGGKRIFDCWKRLYDSIPEGITEHGVCYRTDGDDLAKRTYHTLKKEEIICHGGG
jgi:hypothetical protein